MLAKVMAGVLGTAALAAAYMVHEGAVRVAVDQPRGGKQAKCVHLLVPAALVPVGLAFVPDENLRGAAERARPWLPAIRAASQELRRLPDAELLEVRDARQHVRMAKRGALFVLDLESSDETVHVSFPLKTLEQVVRRLESAGPAL